MNPRPTTRRPAVTSPGPAPWSVPLAVLSRLLRDRLAALARLLRCRLVADAGMSTAEYAVGTVAAVSFAAVLIAVVRSDAVRSALTSIITGALHVG